MDANSDLEPDDPAESDVDLDDSRYYLNRELSELEFQRRVLHEALDDRQPLLERVRFLSIFTKNMDEFFMKRIGGLKQQIDAGVTESTADGRTPEEQWREALETARPMFRAQAECFLNEVRPALREEGIHVHDYDDLTTEQRSETRRYFEESVLPTLTPLAFDPAHPFPFISNLSLSLAVLTERPGEDEPTFTRVKIPQNRPRLVEVGEDEYVLLEEVIRSNLDLLFPKAEVVDTTLFRLTRNAEVRRNQEVAEDLIEMIREVLEQRRFATAVRLDVEEGASDRVVDLLVEQLDISEREVFRLPGPLDFRELMDLTELDRPDLKLDPWTPQPHPRFRRSGSSAEVGTDTSNCIFSEIQRDDILLHHPYHSFGETVQEFLDQAANDPNVLAIKAAIYRTASDSKVIQSLIDAADNGKQVAVMVELKARFDEQNNLEWVRRLEEEGIHVAYGTVGLKTHTKTALVVREEDDGVELYSHVATGNYHSGTAKGYVDLGLLTADRDIGRDLVKVFNFFTGPSLDEEFRKLLIAPVTMRERFTHFIRREARHARKGEDARIVTKVNALEDPEFVEELYRASMAGVDIDLVVRGICRLRPGLEGISENITVHSIVDRFLEHSRIYYFENAGDPEWYLGSADWMTRNLDNRVEAVAPVEDPDLREQLRFVLELAMSDNQKRWTMNADGSYDQRYPRDGEPVVNMQSILMEQTLESLRQTGVESGFLPDSPATPEELLVEPVDGSDDDDADGSDDSTRDSGDGSDRSDATKAESTAASGGGAAVASDAELGDPGPAGASLVRNRADADASAVENGADPRSDAAATDADDAEDADLPRAMRVHDDRWYVPESDHYAYAVRTPDGGRAYRKTKTAAASLLERYYG
ncbi:polyphosphate kinase 1 [Halopelagius longus]|uniref:Polyphosphate kinase n=1 Tax=Halopelagius longus TaxID=1236180 RepID=A0A1H1AEL9_9EURY|nr:polyphosphate kinase 1 [Halopelagius longus]RDI70349.1 polyphosphate kinase 1 [Halopelagius longus]SDQ38041.1 polyphosphate kinase [Halopelagius longus]